MKTYSAEAPLSDEVKDVLLNPVERKKVFDSLIGNRQDFVTVKMKDGKDRTLVSSSYTVAHNSTRS